MTSLRSVTLALDTLLVGPGATRAEKGLSYGVATVAGAACVVYLNLNAGLDHWQTLLYALLAFDIAGGSVACSLGPLQRHHRARYASNIKQAIFTMAHFPHVLALLWLLCDASVQAALYGLVVLTLGCVACAMKPSRVEGGIRSAAFLASSAVSLTALSTTTLQGLLLTGLFYKLFVAFPSFRQPSAGVNGG